MPKLRKMLGSATSPYIVALMDQIETQSKETLVNWSLHYVQTHILPIYETAYPGDERPRQAIVAAHRWMNKEIKLPEAKHYILACHEAAREGIDTPAAQAAARAVGQAASTIHAATHCLGIAFYGAAAIAYSTAGLLETAEIYDAIAQKVCTEILASLKAVSVENEANPAKINWRC